MSNRNYIVCMHDDADTEVPFENMHLACEFAVRMARIDHLHIYSVLNAKSDTGPKSWPLPIEVSYGWDDDFKSIVKTSRVPESAFKS